MHFCKGRTSACYDSQQIWCAFTGQEIAGNFEEDFVPRETFLQEARELLQGALESQEELEKSVKSG